MGETLGEQVGLQPPILSRKWEGYKLKWPSKFILMNHKDIETILSQNTGPSYNIVYKNKTQEAVQKSISEGG